MQTNTEIKENVRKKYATIARSDASCCGTTPDLEEEINFVGEDYTTRAGYVADADLGLGCGVPTDLANIKPGNTVLDLGSGAGIDAFVARSIVGDHGKVIGVDMTEEMIHKARKNTQKLGFQNVDFIKGDIEDLPLQENNVDVIISNCVLNLVPDKLQAFSEMHRVLKSGGHFCVSDIVVRKEYSQRLREIATLYAGCVSGAIELDHYISLLKQVGFKDINILKQHTIDIPESLIPKDLTEAELQEVNDPDNGVISITITGTKP